MGNIGRPKKEVIKDKFAAVRMTDEEYQELKDFCQKNNQSIGDILKEGVRLVYKKASSN